MRAFMHTMRTVTFFSLVLSRPFFFGMQRPERHPMAPAGGVGFCLKSLCNVYISHTREEILINTEPRCAFLLCIRNSMTMWHLIWHNSPTNGKRTPIECSQKPVQQQVLLKEIQTDRGRENRVGGRERECVSTEQLIGTGISLCEHWLASL